MISDDCKFYGGTFLRPPPPPDTDPMSAKKRNYDLYPGPFRTDPSREYQITVAVGWAYIQGFGPRGRGMKGRGNGGGDGIAS